MYAGMIGLGAMGANMARNLAKAGLLKMVWNRTTETASTLAQEFGVEAVDTPAILAANVDIIFICVSADQDVLEMINAIAPTARPGTIVVDTSTVSCDTAKYAAEILKEKQVEFLDAPVSGGVEGAEKGTLAMMLGGDLTALDKIRPALEAMTSRIMHMGETGSGQSTKAVNQIMAAGINQAVTEALAFGVAQGLPMDKVIAVMSSGAADNWFMQHRGPSMIKGSYAPGFRLSLHYKDLKICRAMAKQNGAHTDLLDMTINNYEKLIKDDFADEDISSLYRLKRI